MENTWLGKSFRKRSGPRNVSHGTSEVTGADGEDWPSTRTCCDCVCRLIVIHCRSVPLIL